MMEGKSACKAKTIEHYDKFPHLWKDADLAFPN